MAAASEETTTPFEKRLAENCAEYLICLSLVPDTDRRAQLLQLEDIRKAAFSLYEQLAPDYIWQRDGFNLEVKNEPNLAYLHGITDYGDSVEDEWLIVYLLRELTRSRHDIWVRVFDGDGEFLLIEAANVLPRWLNPEMDSNRVWLHCGKLYIIPADNRPRDTESRTLSLPDALHVVRTRSESLVQSDLIEAEAFYRLEKYPGQIHSSLHRAKVTIPRKLAYILHQRPKAVAPAVETFYLRDALSLKPVTSTTGQAHLPPDDLVTISVTFTRVLFAQLRSQRFDPPQRWSAVFREVQDSDRFRLEMGMKLTCGFEMMIHKLDKTDSRLAREVGIILQDLEEDGDEILPTDEAIRTWKDHDVQDDDSWLDINYEDFERELGGSRGRDRSGATESGFGDEATQTDLRKMVSRFEAFLNDESAGLDGADVEEMDFDDGDGDSDLQEDSEDEDKAVSFDEEAYTRMFKIMMGLPSDEQHPPTDQGTKNDLEPKAKEEVGDDGIQELAAQFEAELNEHGALKLDPKAPMEQAAIQDRGKGKEVARDASEDVSSDEEGEVDIDYNLAKNLLESYKSQAGMAGPAGNMLGMLGMTLPRDEDDGTQSQGGKK